MHGDVLCVFCRHCIEGRDHLFFQCGFSKRIWQAILKICLVDEVHTCWDDVLRWGLKSWKKSLKPNLCRLGWSAAIYNIWKHQNNIRHGNQILTKEKIVARIKWEVRTKAIAIGRFKRTAENEAVCESWGIHVTILF